MPLRYVCEIAEGGTWARLRVRGGERARGRRGRVRGFSGPSRKRLLDLFNKIPLKIRENALFVTLTYPASYPGDWEHWKRDLDVFFKRLARQWPGFSAVWKLEFQVRGAPHFHVLVMGVPFIPHKWVARAWFEVVGSGDPAHFRAGTEVRRCKNDRMTQYYIAKYMGKGVDREDLAPTGRFWGVRGRVRLRISIWAFDIPVSVFYAVRRSLRLYLEKRLKRKVRWGVSAGQGLTVYVEGVWLVRLVKSALECA